MFKKGKTENQHAYILLKIASWRGESLEREREVFNIVCERVNKILKNLVTKN